MVGRMVGLTFVTWAGLTIGQSSIEALLFSRYGVDQLPVLYLLLGLLLFLASLGVTAMLGRMARESLFVLMPLVLAALLVAGRLAVEAGSDRKPTGHQEQSQYEWHQHEEPLPGHPAEHRGHAERGEKEQEPE